MRRGLEYFTVGAYVRNPEPDASGRTVWIESVCGSRMRSETVTQVKPWVPKRRKADSAART